MKINGHVVVSGGAGGVLGPIGLIIILIQSVVIIKRHLKNGRKG